MKLFHFHTDTLQAFILLKNYSSHPLYLLTNFWNSSWYCVQISKGFPTFLNPSLSKLQLPGFSLLWLHFCWYPSYFSRLKPRQQKKEQHLSSGNSFGNARAVLMVRVRPPFEWGNRSRDSSDSTNTNRVNWENIRRIDISVTKRY